jgi:hypothetical protein
LLNVFNKILDVISMKFIDQFVEFQRLKKMKYFIYFRAMNFVNIQMMKYNRLMLNYFYGLYFLIIIIYHYIFGDNLMWIFILNYYLLIILFLLGSIMWCVGCCTYLSSYSRFMCKTKFNRKCNCTKIKRSCWVNIFQ